MPEPERLSGVDYDDDETTAPESPSRQARALSDASPQGESSHRTAQIVALLRTWNYSY